MSQLTELVESVERSTDSWGNRYVNGVSSLSNLNSSYGFSPERFRLFYDEGTTGTYERRFVQYGDAGNYTEGHELWPDQGDTIKFRSADRFRYNVQFDLLASLAFSLSRTLDKNTDDKVTIAYGEADLNNDMTSADGWIIEIDGSLPADSVHFSQYRNGTIKSNGGTRKRVKLDAAVTLWQRLAMNVNWYNVGEAKLEQSYSVGNEQRNVVAGTIASNGQRGPSTANQPIEISVRRDSATSPLDVRVGCMACVSLSDKTAMVRQKSFKFEEDVAGDDDWEPLAAIRQDPNRPGVFLEFLPTDIIDFSGNSECDLLFSAIGEEKVSFGGGDSWSSPSSSGVTATNSTVQVRTDLTQYPDDTGAVVGSTQSPGGFQLGNTSINVDVGLFRRSLNTRLDTVTRRPIQNGDIVVCLGRSASSGTIKWINTVEEEW